MSRQTVGGLVHTDLFLHHLNTYYRFSVGSCLCDVHAPDFACYLDRDQIGSWAAFQKHDDRWHVLYRGGNAATTWTTDEVRTAADCQFQVFHLYRDDDYLDLQPPKAMVDRIFKAVLAKREKLLDRNPDWTAHLAEKAMREAYDAALAANREELALAVGFADHSEKACPAPDTETPQTG